MKRKRINRILGQLYDLALWPQPWLWPWSFKVRVWNSFISGMGQPIDMEWKGCVSHPLMTMILTSVTMVGWANVRDSDPDDFRRWCAVDISSVSRSNGKISYHLVNRILGMQISSFWMIVQLFHVGAIIAKMFWWLASGSCGLIFNNTLTHWPLGKFEWNFRYVIFKWILMIDGWGVSCEVALIWMSLDLTDDQSTLVQVMAWCRQATSHYLSQCWLRSLSPYGDNELRPQWVKTCSQTSMNIRAWMNN